VPAGLPDPHAGLPPFARCLAATAPPPTKKRVG
jgi:hypothetical protein